MLCFLLQWTSEPYESVDATYSNAAATVKDATQSSDGGCSQGLEKTQEESPSASTDQKTVWGREHALIPERPHSCSHAERTARKVTHKHRADCTRERLLCSASACGLILSECKQVGEHELRPSWWIKDIFNRVWLFLLIHLWKRQRKTRSHLAKIY